MFTRLQVTNCKKKSQCSQWFVRWTPFAGNHLHEFKAAVVQLNVRGVVVLRVDLASPQRATVFGLNMETQESKLNFGNSKCQETISQMQRKGRGTLYMLLVFFLGLVS